MRETLNLEYVHAGDVRGYLERHKGHVLGVVAFGAHAPEPSEALPFAPLWVNVPVLGGYDASFEVWTSGNAVTSCSAGDINAFTDGAVLFGSMRMEQSSGMTLEAVSRRMYLEIFAYLVRAGCPSLLRVWNYLPQINEPENGLERYRCFNVGRHEAYLQGGRDISEENMPAASVLGCGPGPMVIYFLASNKPGMAVDNPRQLTAYRYPERYGPRSPLFVRAMLASFGEERCLMVSGTASIVGHETMHKGDAEQQALETMRNIRTLLQQAYPSGGEGAARGRMQLKVYIRHPADLERVREHIEHVFGPGQQTVFLLSDVCRTDLLLEIEAVHFSAAGVEAGR